MKWLRLIPILALVFAVLYPDATPVDFLPAQTSLSSQTDLSCRDLFADDGRQVFHAQQFADFQAKYRSRPQTIDERNWQTKTPEEMLAIVEAYGAKDGQAFNVAAFLNEASDKDLKKLTEIMRSWNRSAQITEPEIRGLITKLYRLIHPSESIWHWLRNPTGFQERYESVSDEIIFEHLKTEWSSRSLIAVFSDWGLLNTPSRVGRAREFLKDRRNPIYVMMTIALNVVGVANGDPGILVGRLRFMNAKKIAQADIDLMERIGFEPAMKTLNALYEKQRNWQFSSDLIRRAFNLGVSIFLITTLPQQIHEQRQEQATQAFQEVVQVLNDESGKPKDPEAQAQMLFDDLVAHLQNKDPQHRPVDRTTPEMQMILAQFKAAFSRAHQDQAN